MKKIHEWMPKAGLVGTLLAIALLSGCGSGGGGGDGSVTHQVTATAGSGGSITPQSVTVNDGATTTLTVTVNAGYSLSGITGCGGSLSGFTYTTGIVTADCQVTASFDSMAVTHQVTATAGTGGSITPASKTVDDGASTTFTVTVDAGYSLADVTGCGGSLSGFTYTTGIVTADCQVTASFDSMAVTHQVTATAGTGGSITPASRTVDDGATTTFTVTPDAGNFIAGVTGCGGLLSGSTYTTGAVTADCQVSASFGAPSVSDGQAAAIVIGQPDFTSKTPGLTQTGFGSSALFGNVAVDNGILYVPDFDSNRVLGYNTIPSSNEAAADFVLGAANFTTPGSLGGPGSMVAYDGKLYASMYYSNRIDVYNPSPSATGATPAFSLTATGAGGYGGMLNVESVGVGGGKLAVADAGHNRVLVWNSIPASNTDPDLVLGQTTVSGIAANAGGLSASSMRYPSGIWTDGTRLVVLDKDNNRVLVWNTFPTTNGQAADLVLGQADSTSAQLNRGLGAPTAATLNEPYNGVYSDGIRLFVTDSNNNRVLVWNSWPTQSGQAADAVLGQPDFVSSAPATTETGMDGPTGVILVGTQLLVTDGRNVRCMIYNLP